jgi:hypothetical protein
MDYGVTPNGFVVKPFVQTLNEKLDLARQLFGADVDLRSTSALRKLLDIVATEDNELWKSLERSYYAGFVSTASGDALDLLGEDVGTERGFLKSAGLVHFALSGEAPGRGYQLPRGTIVETDPPILRFRTTESLTLSSSHKQGSVAAEALEPGPDGNIPKNAVKRVNALYAAHYLSLGSAVIAAANDAPFAGGDAVADDETYRGRLLGRSRTLWTADAVLDAVRAVDGVRDCRLSDPLGGVDVSKSLFNLFAYGKRRFGQQRFLGTPYFFDVLVAPYPGFLWESDGGAIGVRRAVEAALEGVRPIGIFPNVRLADSVVVGIRANVLTRPGVSADGVTAALKDVFGRRLAGLGLGGSVVYAEVLCDCMNVSGVVDIQNVHLRRYPPLFGQIAFGDREPFLSEVIEADIGENLALSSTEVAVFVYDSGLIDLQVSEK